MCRIWGSSVRRDPANVGSQLADEMIEGRTADDPTPGDLTRPWDMLMAVYVVTDRLATPLLARRRNTPRSASAWEPIRQVYRRIDRAIGETLEMLDRDCNVFVVSDHGFGLSRRWLQSCSIRLFARLGTAALPGKRRLALTGRLLAAGTLKIRASRSFPSNGKAGPLTCAFPRIYNRAKHDVARFHDRLVGDSRLLHRPGSGRVYVDTDWLEHRSVYANRGISRSLRDRVRSIILEHPGPRQRCSGCQERPSQRRGLSRTFRARWW